MFSSSPPSSLPKSVSSPSPCAARTGDRGRGLSGLIEFIDAHRAFAVVGHEKPDGDCVGSSLALASFLRRIGKEVELLSAGPFKRREIAAYATLFRPSLSAQIRPSDQTAVIVVDCSELSRVGAELASQLAPFARAFIDHHETCGDHCAHSFVVKTAPSTTTLVQTLIETMAGSLEAAEARALFLGLATDTGFFRHLDEHSADTFASAARLVRAGANPKDTFLAMNGGRSLASRMLIARVLSRLTPYYGGALMTSYETCEDAVQLGLDVRDSDALYQLIQSIQGVEAIVVVRQESPTHCSVGFRSRGSIDVSVIAARFGGGGHRCAAGLRI